MQYLKNCKTHTLVLDYCAPYSSLTEQYIRLLIVEILCQPTVLLCQNVKKCKCGNIQRQPKPVLLGLSKDYRVLTQDAP